MECGSRGQQARLVRACMVEPEVAGVALRARLAPEQLLHVRSYQQRGRKREPQVAVLAPRQVGHLLAAGSSRLESSYKILMN